MFRFSEQQSKQHPRSQISRLCEWIKTKLVYGAGHAHVMLVRTDGFSFFFFVESVARWQSHQSKVWCWWNIDDLNTPMLTWSHAATPTDICTRTAPRACKKSVAVEILIGSYWGHVYLQTHEMLVSKSRSLTTLFQHPNISSLIVIAAVITERMI